jgi:biopolymer transport protein ExbD
MTPMIDVVFLLLIFFIVTIQPQDLLARLDVSRPAAPPTELSPMTLLRIDVGVKGYEINGRRLPLETLHRRLSKLYKNTPSTTLTIASTSNASHSQLVKLLNACADIGIENISLMSL